MPNKTPVNAYTEYMSTGLMLETAQNPYSRPNAFGMTMNFDVNYPFGAPMINNMD